MPQGMGYLVGSKKWLVTRYLQQPGQLITLGSVLTDPEEPETSLNFPVGIVPILEANIRDESIAIPHSIHSKLSKDFSVLLKGVPPNSPFCSAGLALQGQNENAVETAIEVTNVHAKVFQPTEEYMNKVLAVPAVVDCIRRAHFRKSLYIIVGVATASGISVTETTTRGKLASAGVNVSITGTGLEFAAESSKGSNQEGTSKLQVQDECDFAYRVREFVYSKFLKKGLRDKGDKTDGAFFGWNSVNTAPSDLPLDTDEAVPVFDYLDEDDIDSTTEGILSF